MLAATVLEHCVHVDRNIDPALAHAGIAVYRRTGDDAAMRRRGEALAERAEALAARLPLTIPAAVRRLEIAALDRGIIALDHAPCRRRAGVRRLCRRGRGDQG